MTTQIASSEIQTAIYNKLSPAGVIDSQLAAQGFTGVFDIRNVPEGQSFDYITIGDSLERPKNTLGRRGYLARTIIHIWSRQAATAPTTAAAARMNALLDQRPLTLATHTHVYTMFDDLLIPPDKEKDGLTLHSTLIYMIYTEE
jgi:hypothetical protein